MQDVAQGYETEGNESGVTYPFPCAQSIKPENLESVISVSAPADADGAAGATVKVIDRVIELDADDQPPRLWSVRTADGPYNGPSSILETDRRLFR